MKKLIIYIAVLLLAFACNKPAAKVTLDLTEGTSTNVELYKLNLNRLSFVDSLNTDKKGHLT